MPIHYKNELLKHIANNPDSLVILDDESAKEMNRLIQAFEFNSCGFKFSFNIPPSPQLVTKVLTELLSFIQVCEDKKPGTKEHFQHYLHAFYAELNPQEIEHFHHHMLMLFYENGLIDSTSPVFQDININFYVSIHHYSKQLSAILQNPRSTHARSLTSLRECLLKDSIRSIRSGKKLTLEIQPLIRLLNLEHLSTQQKNAVQTLIIDCLTCCIETFPQYKIYIIIATSHLLWELDQSKMRIMQDTLRDKIDRLAHTYGDKSPKKLFLQELAFCITYKKGHESYNDCIQSVKEHYPPKTYAPGFISRRVHNLVAAVAALDNQAPSAATGTMMAFEPMLTLPSVSHSSTYSAQPNL